MDVTVYWTILILCLILSVMAVAVVVLVIRGRETEVLRNTALTPWRVELWNISQGYQIELCFINTYTIGRLSLYENIVCGWPTEMDVTISREHCMLYEQNGMLLAWNMSAINPTSINGYRLYQPVQIVPGDRIELGNSVFLVTRVEHI